jgi:hypothetical protein
MLDPEFPPIKRALTKGLAVFKKHLADAHRLTNPDASRVQVWLRENEETGDMYFHFEYQLQGRSWEKDKDEVSRLKSRNIEFDHVVQPSDLL